MSARRSPSPLRVAVAAGRLARERAASVLWPLHHPAGEDSPSSREPESTRAIEFIETSGSVAALRRIVRMGQADVAIIPFVDLPLDDVGPRSSAVEAAGTGTSAESLRVAAVPPRDDPREALVSREGTAFTYLPQGTVFGVHRAARRAQLLRRRGDLVLRDAPADLDARMRLLESGAIGAFVAAACDLRHAGHRERVAEWIDTRQMLPSAGQGAVRLEVRAEDEASAERLASLHDLPTAFAVRAERSCLARLGGGTGAEAGVGVLAVTDGEMMFIHGFVGALDGREATRLRWQGPMRDASEVGATLAELLLAAGADRLLPGAAPPPHLDVEPRL